MSSDTYALEVQVPISLVEALRLHFSLQTGQADPVIDRHTKTVMRHEESANHLWLHPWPGVPSFLCTYHTRSEEWKNLRRFARTHRMRAALLDMLAWEAAVDLNLAIAEGEV